MINKKYINYIFKHMFIMKKSLIKIISIRCIFIVIFSNFIKIYPCLSLHSILYTILLICIRISIYWCTDTLMSLCLRITTIFNIMSSLRSRKMLSRFKLHSSDFTLSKTPMLYWWNFMYHWSIWFLLSFVATRLIKMSHSTMNSLIWHLKILIIVKILVLINSLPLIILLVFGNLQLLCPSH